MAKNDFSGAYDIFTELGSYKDSMRLAMECGNKRDYALAEHYWKTNKYYSAYKLYKKLGDYLNSEERAAVCLQPYPKTGKVFCDYDYKQSFGGSLTIKAPDDGYYTFIKIYSGFLFENSSYNDFKDHLIYTIIIAPGEKAEVDLSGGSYIVKQAYGTTWYGPEEAFGEDGTYSVMMFKDDDGTYNTLLDIERNYDFLTTHTYTLKLRQSTGNVGSAAINFADF